MKLGMPTLIEYASMADNVRLCHTLGLHFIELNMNLPICMPESLSYTEINDYREKYGIDFTIHLPEELDLTSYHPSIRQGHIERCKQTMEWASLSGVRTLNMHLNNGIYFTLPHAKVWINEQYEAKFLELLHDSYEELYGLADAFGIELCIENTGQFHIPYIRRALDRLTAFPGFSLTWDVGHDAKAGFAEESIFNHFHNRIKHMHLHDYNGKSDHQSLYTGVVPLKDRLNFAKEHDLSVVIEVKTSESLADSVAALKQHGYMD